VSALLDQLGATTEALLPGRYDALFYLPPRIPLTADDVRVADEEFQRRTDEAIKSGLERWSVQHVEIDVTDEEAEARVLEQLSPL
jgi:hypothetical protein